MRLLHTRYGEFVQFEGHDVPRYAILSHRRSDHEVSYPEVLESRRAFNFETSGSHGLARIGQAILASKSDGYGWDGFAKALWAGTDVAYGWKKILQACELARRDNLNWIWVDTCCIDKRSSAELSEAINSMYEWYKKSRVCYVFLPDVYTTDRNICSRCKGATRHISSSLEWMSDEDLLRDSPLDGGLAREEHAWFCVPEFIDSTWFTRAWTLQELVAPRLVRFYNADFRPIGTRLRMVDLIIMATSIDEAVLNGKRMAYSSVEKDAVCISIAERMNWAARRVATREEDRAYSLLGLFQVNMPLLYGEGHRAFKRLQTELIRQVDDESIFAWQPKDFRSNVQRDIYTTIDSMSLLASDIEDFSRHGPHPRPAFANLSGLDSKIAF